VVKTATPAEIKQAYRRLAMQHHPDRGGDQNRFQEIQQAYDVLGNDQKRAQYDSPQPQGVNFGFGGNFQDIFDMFARGGGGFGQFHQNNQRRGHVRVEIWLSLLDVATGGSRTVNLAVQNNVSTVDIQIPPGINDGDHVQYPGLAPGPQDLVVTFRVRPDPVWKRDGLDLHRQSDVVVWDLILGGELRLTDILGEELVARIPPGTQPGTRLRLRDRGLRDQSGRRGNILIELNARLPESIPENLIEAIRQTTSK
jgi:DnaJ-class molecular chaperone